MSELARSVDISSETVLTETLPEGALFVSPEGVLYKVVMAERAGFRKAEPWPATALNQAGDSKKPVALVSGSLLARNYPVVTKGRPLPTLIRSDFLDCDSRPTHYVFPSEPLARLAAWLDETLSPRSGLVASKEQQRWLLSDGRHSFRIYHYEVDNLGLAIDLASRFARERIVAQPCERGPRYWRHIPNWPESLGASVTAEEPPMEPVSEGKAKSDVAMPTPIIPAAAGKVEAQPGADAPPPVATLAQDTPKALKRRQVRLRGAEGPLWAVQMFDWRTWVDFFTRKRRKQAPDITDQAVPSAIQEPKVKAAVETVSEAAEKEMQPVMDRSVERVAPTAVDRPQSLSVPETPPEAVVPAVIDQVEIPPPAETPSSEAAATTTAMALEQNPMPPAPARRPKARPVRSPTKKPGARPVAQSPVAPDKVTAPGRAAPAEGFAFKSGRSQMILSLDIGYGYTKGVGPDGLRFSFPSVIGTAEDIPFSIGLIQGDEDRVVKYGDWTFSYGEHALLQSRIQSTIFDRSRVRDHVYKMLFVAALVEMSKVASDCKRVKVITGLPVDFFNDRAEVVKAFEGAYQITTNRAIKCAVESVYVTPQPFGSLFRELLNDKGKIVNHDIEKRRIGVIDVGTYTTDFIVADELRYVQRLSGTIRIGWSKVISKVQQVLSDRYRLELAPHQVDRALQAGEVRVHGDMVPLEPLIAPALTEIQTAVIARARDLWGEAADLDTILVTGGAGAPLYDAVREAYPHARLLENAFWANVEGLQRFARRPATFHE